MIKSITDAMKVQMVKDILLKDSVVREVGVSDGNVYFFTTDKMSCEESETGYFSDDGYDWDNHGLCVLTEARLKAMGCFVDYNDCEGCEDEGYVFIK